MEPQILNSIIENPCTIAESLDSKESYKWLEAIKDEYKSLIKHKTWELVEKQKPDGKNITGCKSVFAIKHNPDGTVEIYKAR